MNHIHANNQWGEAAIGELLTPQKACAERANVNRRSSECFRLLRVGRSETERNGTEYKSPVAKGGKRWRVNDGRVAAAEPRGLGHVSLGGPRSDEQYREVACPSGHDPRN